jgi:cereblon
MNGAAEQARSPASGMPRDPGAERAPADRPATDSGDQERWVCRTCRNPIASRAALFGSSGRPQVFANPHGLVFEIITFRAAEGLLGVGGVIAEFSWFPGYAWRVVCCSGCATHLGWHFTAASADVSPLEFFGLLMNELAEELG